MGEVESQAYADKPYGEADTLARRVIREGKMIMRDCYRWRGTTYWIVGGRCLTREQGARLADERRREGRITR